MRTGCNILPPHHPQLRSRLWLAHYLNRAALPSPEPSVDWSLAVVDADEVWANDTLGDCTCAGYANIVQAVTANCDGEIDPKLAEVLAMYNIVGNGQDDGATLEDCNDYMTKFGLAGVKLANAVAINVQDITQCKIGAQLFCGLYSAVALPKNAMDLFDAGRVWDAVANDGGFDGGHCMWVAGYSPNGVMFKTWGKIQLATWAWWLKYAIQAYAVLLPKWISTMGISPSGFNLAQLQADQANL